VNFPSKRLLCAQEASVKLRSARVCLLVVAYCLLPITYHPSTAAAAESQKLSVYAPQARYTLPVLSDNGEYVDVFTLVEPLAVSEITTKGATWKLRIHDPKAPDKMTEAQFEEDSAVAKVRDQKITLSAPARNMDHRLMLPLHGIGAVLIPLLGTDLIFHESSRRMFIGGVAELVSSELRKGETSTMLLHFPEPVNPSINSEGNSLKLSFGRDPVVAFEAKEAINDKLFSSSSFIEDNGSATLTINGTAPLLARFADGGKTIQISAAPAPPITATAVPTPTPQPSTPSVSQNSVSQESAPPDSLAPDSNPPSNMSPVNSTANQQAHRPPESPTFSVVIDPGHGGNDVGARIAPNVLEKNLTLALARRLRLELQTRHIAVTLLRDGDTDVALEQRVAMTNLARPSLCISLHVEPGTVLRIYTAAFAGLSGGGLDRNGFLPWQTAQSAFLTESNAFAAVAAESMAKREITTQVRATFLQPMHSIAAPVIALEAPANNKGLRVSEELIAGALADAIAVRKLGGGTQ
jgi:N-acetylmuramoyl-L-alanine amidase